MFELMNIYVSQDRTITISLDEVIGSVRTFGRVGPMYEVLTTSGAATGSDVVLRIRVVESGEELDYPLAAALDDPLAS